MSRIIVPLLTTLLLFAFFGTLHANDVKIDNISLTGQNTSEGYVYVQFDLSWENSWRVTDGPGNWDAAWVFVKYRTEGSSTWRHARLYASGHSAGSGTPALVQTGLIHENLPYNSSSNPGMGAFFYRSGAGSGEFSITGAQLRWNYASNGINNTDVVDVQVFAIEKIFIPEGSFYLGDGQTGGYQFYEGNTPGSPFLVTSAGAIEVGQNAGELFYNRGSGSAEEFIHDQVGPIPASFPNGYAGFYIMKHPVTQQQMVDFLNTLTTTQANTIFREGLWDTHLQFNQHNRNMMEFNNGFYETQAPLVPIHYITMEDPHAYASWSSTRVMTELEFEKAARGPMFPEVGEFAWGNNSIAVDQYSFENIGQADERVSGNYQENVGNAYHPQTTNSIDTHGSVGPTRVGIFATSASSRVQAGASYYGVLDMTGNVEDYMVLATTLTGRLMTGEHGNGTLTNFGRMTFSYDVPQFAMSRGGSYWNGGSWNQVSNRVRARQPAAFDFDSMGIGFRVVRSQPSSPTE